MYNHGLLESDLLHLPHLLLADIIITLLTLLREARPCILRTAGEGGHMLPLFLEEETSLVITTTTILIMLEILRIIVVVSPTVINLN